MVILGVTGGIGSGKSIVCKILSLYDIPVYDADKKAKNLNDTSVIIRRKLIDRFGEQLYKDNLLDRKLLANHIFNNKDKLNYVNKVIHTELAKDFLSWIKTKQDYNIIAIDAAVLFESGFDQYVDKTITVTAPTDIRINRVSKRDNLSEIQIKSRINSQINDKQRIELSDFIIINDENTSLISQVNEIIDNLSNLVQH